MTEQERTARNALNLLKQICKSHMECCDYCILHKSRHCSFLMLVQALGRTDK